MIYRRVNPQKLDAVRGDLDVTVTQARPRIEETTKPNVNCDSTEGDSTMTSYNAANERIKRQYFAYLAEAQGHSEQTIDAAAKALARFEAYTRWRISRRFMSSRPRPSSAAWPISVAAGVASR